MQKLLTAAAFVAFASPAAALTLDFSDPMFMRSGNDVTLTFMDAAPGVDLTVTATSLDSFPGDETDNTGNGGVVAEDLFQLNLSTVNPNDAQLNFSFTDATTGLPVFLEDLEISVLDLDSRNGDAVPREQVTVNTSASITTTTNTLLTRIGSSVVNGATTAIPNVTTGNIASLTAAQQNAAFTLTFGRVSEFDLEIATLLDGLAGRNFFFGNFEFTEPTTTERIGAVPLPAPALLLLTGLGAIGLLRARRA